VWTFSQGTITADQVWLTGELTFRIDEAAVGGSVTNVAPITPRLTGSTYKMRRVNISFGCADLAGSWKSIFADAPKN
jgi:hypothetical protein